MQYKIITELLNLPNFQVVTMFLDSDTSLHLYLDFIERSRLFVRHAPRFILIFPQHRLDPDRGFNSMQQAGFCFM